MPKGKLDTSKRDAFEAEFYKEFAELMKKKRIESGLTQERLAAFLDCSRGSIMNLEMGRFNCHFMLGLKVSKLLKIDLDKLMEKSIAEISGLLG